MREQAQPSTKPMSRTDSPCAVLGKTSVTPSPTSFFAVWRPPTPRIPSEDLPPRVGVNEANQAPPHMQSGRENDARPGTHVPAAQSVSAVGHARGAMAAAEAPSEGKAVSPAAAQGRHCIASIPTPVGRRRVAVPSPPASAPTAPPVERGDGTAWPTSLQALRDETRLLTVLGAVPLRRNLQKIPGLALPYRSISALLPGPPETCVAMHVFTDGSFDPGARLHRGGWAFNVFIQQTDASQPLAFLGYACGSLRPWVASSAAIDYSSYDAEAVAILMAAIWALPLTAGLPIHFHVDSQSVLGAANGSYQTAGSETDRAAAALARAAVQILEAQGRTIVWHWVPGHKGIAGNEISDALSKAAALEVWQDTDLPTAVWNVVLHPLFGWLWRDFTATDDCPPLDFLQAGKYEPADNVPVGLLQPKVHVEAPSPTAITLKVGSLNVQSLKENKDELWHLLNKERFNVVGLQETREGNDHQCKGRGFFEVHAAGYGGNHGISLIFAKNVPYGWQGANPLHILPEHVSCLHAEPTILVCAVHAPGLNLCCVSAHAPHSGNTHTEITGWWRRLAQAIPKDAAGKLLLLIDANARVGSISAAGIGAHAKEEECHAGAHLRELADDLQMWLPATFADRKGLVDPCACEPTWVSPHGTMHRIDYVCLPRSWAESSVSAWVHKDLLPTRPHEDHWAACATVHFLAQCAATRESGSAFPKDPGMATDRCHAAVRDFWCAPPQVSWEVNVHEHMQTLNEGVAQVIGSLPPPPPRKTRPFVSEEAAQLLRDCKRLRCSLRGFDRLERKLRLRTILYAWSAQRSQRPVSREGWTLRDVRAIKCVFIHWLHVDRSAARNTIRADKAIFAGKRLQALQQAGQANNAKAFYKALAPLRPPGKKIIKPFAPLVLSTSEDGTLPDPSALLAAKREHFAALEAGSVVHLQELFTDSNTGPGEDASFTIGELPTLSQIEHLVRSIQTGKAPNPGMDLAVQS